MVAPKPVALTRVNENAYDGPDPQPLVVVGTVPANAAPVALTAVPGTFADEAAVQTYLATLVAELKSSEHFS